MAKEKINRQGANLDAALEESFIQKNLKKIAIACGAVVAIVIVCIGANAYMNNRNEKAAEDLYPCEHYFQAGNFDKALNGDGQKCIGFIAVADQYSMTKTGNLAKLYAGISYYQLGKYEDAKKYLEDYSTKDDEMVSPAAMATLGNAYIALGETEKGAEALVKAAKKADNNVESPMFLVQAGQVYESLGNKDKALELYQEVKNHYRGSADGSEIDKYIERIEIAK